MYVIVTTVYNICVFLGCDGKGGIMSEEFSIEKLREEVNPVYNTAHSCLQIVAAVGDEDSDTLRKALGFTVFGADRKERAANIPPEVLAALMKAIPVFTSMPEARFFSSNNFIRESGAKQVMDLPCGYTARGVKLAKSGIRYFGMDLPAVISEMKPAVKKMIGDNENISYHEVDATNYSSLRKALEGADGELHITTEGMLMYFTQSELETVFGNIRKLLLEFGGRWVTVDRELNNAANKTMSITMEGVPDDLAVKIGAMAAGASSKTTMYNNVFFDEDTDKVKKFVSDMGFDLETIPMSRYMPEKLAAFKDLPENIAARATEAIGETCFWVMTAREGSEENFTCEEDNFKANVELIGQTLHVTLAGRLDTITAPGLLALYREAESKGGYNDICIDMKELEYISSAGLRVLLIMKKALADNGGFNLINMNNSVKEIIETTGFDTIFC